MENIIFKFDRATGIKASRITLDELKQTIACNSYDTPNHAVGIEKIVETVSNEISGTHLKEIFVSNSPHTGWGYDDSKNGDPLKNSILKYHIFRRLICKIDVPVSIKGGSLQIAVKYDNNKFTVGFGANIDICRNMMIMGIGNIISTGLRSGKKLLFDNLLKVVRVWAEDATLNSEKINQFIERCENIELQEKHVNRLIGVLSRASVLSGPKQILKGYQVTNLCKNINNVYKDKTRTITAWEFWNKATNNIELFNTDVNSYLDNTVNITNFVDSFNLTDFDNEKNNGAQIANK